LKFLFEILTSLLVHDGADRQQEKEDQKTNKVGIHGVFPARAERAQRSLQR
jgi:hypothetical protein